MMRSKCCLEKGCYFDLVKSSRLLHEEGQFKKWRVMEMERIKRGDMRLYTIRQISKELFFLIPLTVCVIFSLAVYT